VFVDGPDVPTVNLVAGTARTIFIWAQPETDSVGDFKTLHNLSLNLVSSGVTFDFRDNFQINNNPSNRFELIRDSDSVDFPITSSAMLVQVEGGQADSVIGLSAGIAQSDLFTGIGFDQGDNNCVGNPQCESSWLIASIDLFGVNDSGISNVRLQIGELGMNHALERSEDTEVLFGAGVSDPIYNAKDHRSTTLDGDSPDLIINAVPLLVGDYNQNVVVDAADYTVWRDTRGSTTNLIADGNNSGTIETGDYNVWRHNFGRTAGSGSAAAVPEPAALPILVAIVAFVTISPTFRRIQTFACGTPRD
jgi:hypothetical protein